MSGVEFTTKMTVELLKTDFSDSWPVIAARTSTAGDTPSEEESYGLINALVRDRHGSPFEHMSATWRVTAPLFVWREHHRHRHASYNEESGRYRQLESVFYVPDGDRELTQVGKPMDYDLKPGSSSQVSLTRGHLEYNSEESYDRYLDLLDKGIAREVARMVLPLNIMSTCIVTMNSRGLMNFLSLRKSSEDAAYKTTPQREIEYVAEGYEKTFADYAPLTYKSFVENGRVAP